MTELDPSITTTDTRCVPASCRVTLLVGASHQIDVVLPAVVPLTALTSGTLLTVNRALRTRGEQELPPGNYEFARAAGLAALDAGVGLAEHGIRDGDLLALLPAGTSERYPPVVENISTALARWAGEHFPAVSALDAALTGSGLVAVAAGIGGALLWRARWANQVGWIIGATFLTAALIVSATAWLCRRGGTPQPIVNGTIWAAWGFAVTGGMILPPGSHPGAPHALLGAAIGLVGAVVAAKTTGTRLIPSAIITVTIPAVCAAAARLFYDIPGQRIATAALIAVLIGSRLAPVAGLWMAKVPRQPFGRVTGEDIFAALPGQETVSPVEPADPTPSGQQIADLARRSNRVLAGVLVGVAAMQITASIAAINPYRGPQWPFVTVTIVVSLALILRARAFRHRWHAIITVTGAAVSLYSIPAHYGFAAPPQLISAATAAAATIAIAVVGLAAGIIIPRRYFAPPIRITVEYLEYLLLALIIPFAAWAIGIYHYVRLH
jgi:type VII secretion integral membrane protein EccD